MDEKYNIAQNHDKNPPFDSESLSQEEIENRIVSEFDMLKDRCQKIFDGLRDIPNFGNWNPYFQRAFELYHELWKFQLRNRTILEKKGLQRWEIGEIASKIAQLYYHFYLRTSNTSYLVESSKFYEAIRERKYFSSSTMSNDANDCMKHLRYYARFILVSILLGRRSILKELIAELSDLINTCAKILPYNHIQEWQILIQEVTLFLQADTPIHIKDESSFSFGSKRITKNIISFDGCIRPGILKAAILVGCKKHQVKFSELTLDMFRMALSLEYDSSDTELSNFNIKKYWLYRPTEATLLQYIASAREELNKNEVLLLYIAAESYKNEKFTNKNPNTPYNQGGVMLRQKRVSDQNVTNEYMCADAIYPIDITPFTRNPLFIIVESDNSNAFLDLSDNVYGSYVVVFASPLKPSPHLLEPTQTGHLFTWFLQDPLSAFFFTVSKTVLPKDIFEKCRSSFAQTLLTIENILLQNVKIFPNAIQTFLQDGFMRLLFIKFIFCYVTMYLNSCFHIEPREDYLPKIKPEIPKEILLHEKVKLEIISLAQILTVNELFIEKDV